MYREVVSGNVPRCGPARCADGQKDGQQPLLITHLPANFGLCLNALIPLGLAYPVAPGQVLVGWLP